jgi:hypothetical protein
MSSFSPPQRKGENYPKLSLTKKEEEERYKLDNNIITGCTYKIIHLHCSQCPFPYHSPPNQKTKTTKKSSIK